MILKMLTSSVDAIADSYLGKLELRPTHSLTVVGVRRMGEMVGLTIRYPLFFFYAFPHLFSVVLSPASITSLANFSHFIQCYL